MTYMWVTRRRRTLQLLAFSIFCMVAVVASAQSESAAISIDWQSRWITWPNVLATVMMIFHFGSVWQQFRDQNRRLTEVERWRDRLNDENRQKLMMMATS